MTREGSTGLSPVLAAFLDEHFPDFNMPASFLLVFLLQWREKRGEAAHHQPAVRGVAQSCARVCGLGREKCCL